MKTLLLSTMLYLLHLLLLSTMLYLLYLLYLLLLLTMHHQHHLLLLSTTLNFTMCDSLEPDDVGTVACAKNQGTISEGI